MFCSSLASSAGVVACVVSCAKIAGCMFRHHKITVQARKASAINSIVFKRFSSVFAQRVSNVLFFQSCTGSTAFIEHHIQQHKRTTGCEEHSIPVPSPTHAHFQVAPGSGRKRLHASRFCSDRRNCVRSHFCWVLMRHYLLVTQHFDFVWKL